VLSRDYVGLNCSIARTLEVLGDRWTLLVIRNALFKGTRRFEDFVDELGVARNVLSDRLRRLTDHGVLTAVVYQDRPVRHEYQVTPKGRELTPILAALTEWGDRHYAPNGPPRLLVHEQCGGHVHVSLNCETCAREVEAATVRSRPGPGADAADQSQPIRA